VSAARQNGHDPATRRSQPPHHRPRHAGPRPGSAAHRDHYSGPDAAGRGVPPRSGREGASVVGTFKAGTSRVRDVYRRRNMVPATVLVAVLAVASIVTWTIVFTNSTAGSVTSCNASPVAGAGAPQASDALDDQQAAAPGEVRVKVLNAAGQRGQAQLAAAELGELGIAEAAPPDNDPFYPAQDLSCVGQIRYGPDGASAARTLSLVVPCAELVPDGRTGGEVDLALGDDFRDISPGQPVTEALRALGRQTATDGSGAPAPTPDDATLTALRAVDCSS